MPSVAILYGFAEGPAHASRLRQSLQKQGFSVVASPSKADCIIAHSGGILELPAQLSGKLVLSVTPSTGYAYSMRHAAKHKIRQDIAHAWQTGSMGYWLRKSALNIFYACNLTRGLQLWRAAKKYGRDLPTIYAAKVAVVVQPNDPWSGNLLEEVILKHRPYTFITTGGYHDDLWRIPDGYSKLLASLARSAYTDR